VVDKRCQQHVIAFLLEVGRRRGASLTVVRSIEQSHLKAAVETTDSSLGTWDG
jgi:hypothetical protein